MDSFLEQILKEGTHDSQGVFTLNAEKAELKLAAYQLASISQFPAFLLAAGQAAEATELFISFPSLSFSANRGTRIELIGWTLTTNDLKSIGLAALKKETPRELRYLAAVLSTIGHRGDFRLSSDNYQATFSQGVLQPLKAIPEDKSTNSVTIEIDTYLRNELTSGFCGQEKVSSVKVRLGDKEFGAGYDLSAESIEGFAFLHIPSDDLPSVSFGSAPHGSVLEIPGNPAMALGLTRPVEAERSGLWLISEDLIYSAPRGFCPPGVFGVVASDKLRRDLSFELIQNTEYRELREQVFEASKMLCRHIRSQERILNSNRVGILQSIYDGLGIPWDDLDSTLERSLASTPTLKPVRQPKELHALLSRTDELDPIRIDVLLDSYLDQVANSLRESRPEEALLWLKAQAVLKRKLGLFSHRDQLNIQLLQILTSSERALFGKALDPPKELAPLVRYIDTLSRWWVGEKVKTDDLLGHRIHSSWLYPMGLANECSSSWTQLIRLMENKDVSKALDLVAKERELHFKENERSWLQYFWEHRGRLSWPESVRLRVMLSFAGSGNRVDYSQAPIEDALRAILYTEFCRQPFWPHFLALQNRLAPDQRQDCWVKVVARTLIDRCLNRSDQPDLSQPFSPQATS